MPCGFQIHMDMYVWIGGHMYLLVGKCVPNEAQPNSFIMKTAVKKCISLGRSQKNWWLNDST